MTCNRRSRFDVSIDFAAQIVISNKDQRAENPSNIHFLVTFVCWNPFKTPYGHSRETVL